MEKQLLYLAEFPPQTTTTFSLPQDEAVKYPIPATTAVLFLPMHKKLAGGSVGI